MVHSMTKWTETNRLELIVQRDGLDAAIAWAGRTMQTYLEALKDPRHYARTTEYRPKFEESVREFQRWLAQHGTSELKSSNADSRTQQPEGLSVSP